MATYSTNEFKSGLKIILDGDPYAIVENEFVKPGKGQGFSRVKVRNLKTGKVIEKTFKSGETVEAADVMEIDVQYLYNDGTAWHFMEPNTFEQHAVDQTVMRDTYQWLKEQDMCTLTLWGDEPLTIEPPTFVDLAVTQTEPGIRGDTSSGGSKPAVLETGATVRVPLFIQEGEVIRVDTRKAEYMSRVKN